MKASEMKDFSRDELQHKIDEMTTELLHLRIQNSTGRLKNSARVGLLKKDIARALTVLKSRRDTGTPTTRGMKTS